MQSIPSESLAIDRKARVNLPFYDLDLRPAHIRTMDFDEVVIRFSVERAMFEASRILHPAWWHVQHTMTFRPPCG
jgi:hypothetical protein